MEVDKHPMKYALLAIALALLPTTAFACDTYTSSESDPGARTIEVTEASIFLRENGKEFEYVKTSAGTGTGTTVAVIPEIRESAVETTSEPGEFWLGPEKFTEYCK